MFQNLAILKSASAMAEHAGQRQMLAARNIANVDTPQFKAQDLKPFSESLRESPNFEWFTTRDKHIQPLEHLLSHKHVVDNAAGIEPNGNSISVDHEMLRAVDIQKQHARALAIYKSSMNILRTSVKG